MLTLTKVAIAHLLATRYAPGMVETFGRKNLDGIGFLVRNIFMQAHYGHIACLIQLALIVHYLQRMWWYGPWLHLFLLLVSWTGDCTCSSWVEILAL